MLIAKPQVRIISREVTMPSGELARAFFAIIDIHSVIEVKFLGTRPVKEACGNKCELLLDMPRKDEPVRSIKSPFFSTEDIFSAVDLLINQLARAPSRN